MKNNTIKQWRAPRASGRAIRYNLWGEAPQRIFATIPHAPKQSLFVLAIILLSIIGTLQKSIAQNILPTTNTALTSIDKNAYPNKFYYRNICPPDSINKKRLTAVAITTGTIYAGTMHFLNAEWYKNYPRSSFHFFNDNGEWQQMDKAGHVYSAYLGSKIFSTAFRWTGLSEKRSLLYGAGGGLAFQTIIEVLDGFSTQWGFSWGDMTANTVGCALYAGQQLLWHDQRIVYKYSTHRQDYLTPQLLKRANELYGATTPERILKDYNAQTYWLSANLRSFAPNTRIPKWLNLAVGYGAQGMLGGYTNVWTDPTTNQVIDRSDIPRYRQFYLAPDIDFSKIPFRNKSITAFFKIINLKMPLPTLEFNTLGKTKVHGLLF